MMHSTLLASGTSGWAIYAAVVASIALLWNIASWIRDRAAKRWPALRGAVSYHPDEPTNSILHVMNHGQGSARSANYFGAHGTLVFHGPLGMLAPQQPIDITLDFYAGPGRTPFVLGCLDERGVIHLWNNDGKLRRYSQRRARILGHPTEMSEIFKKMYPNVSLPGGHPSGFDLRE